MQGEVRNAAVALYEAIMDKREGKRVSAGSMLMQPREK